MSNKENFSDLNSNARYYANPIEQQILIQGLQRYFSLPERSQNRNKIAKDVSTFLRRFSPHWSHRAVRLWFNNNKHTYFGSNDGTPNAPQNQNINNGPPAPMPMVTAVMPNPQPTSQFFPQQQQQQLNPMPPFLIPIQQPNVPSNPTIPTPQINQLPVPIQTQTAAKPPHPEPHLDDKNIPQTTEKVNVLPPPPPPPPPQILNQKELSQQPPQPQLPTSINNNNSNRTTYPIINSPIYHPLPIPTPNINTQKSSQNNTENQESKPNLTNPPQQLPAPQIMPKINSPKSSHSPIQVSSPVQVVSPRQTPEKIPLTLPPIKVSNIAPNVQSNKRTNTITINNLTNNSSRNISASPSMEGKNIVSSPITSQKYIMRPPIQVGSKILFPPIQLEDDFSVGNLNNFSSFPTSSSFSSEPTIDQSYLSLSRLFKNIQDTEESDPQYDSKIIEFDNRINALKSRCYNIDFDRIQPRLKSTRFPFSREPSTEFNLWNQIPESNSNLDILSEFPMRSPSFSHQFYATDNASVSHGDSFATNIWQARSFEDKKVPYFECTAFGDDIAAYVHLQLQNQTQRVLSFCNYRSNRQKNYGNDNHNTINSMANISSLTNNANSIDDEENSNVYGNKYIDKQWENIVIECNSRVEAMAIGAPFAWLLADGVVTHASFDQNLDSGQVSIPSQYSYIDTYADGSAIASSSSSSNLILISDNLDTIQIHTSYRGMTSVHSLDESMIIGVSLSCMPRQINANGDEMRAFVGHCANVQGIAILSSTTFVSRAEDYTVRIWDVRRRDPVMTITTLHNSVINIAGSSNFVVTAFHNKIGVIDIRGDSGKPILGVSTEDYDAASLNYNQQDDCLAMFGVVEKENNKDSMLFVGGDGQSRQRIFRMYHNFVGIQNE